MSNKIHEYEGSSVTVTYDAGICTHAGECVRGLPQVFDPKARPWVKPDAAQAEELLTVVARCPSGALQATKQGDSEASGASEPTAAGAEESSTNEVSTNTVEVLSDGPLQVRGDLQLVGSDGTTLSEDGEMYLCRCGKSANKPYCDGSHGEAGFDDCGAIPDPQIRGGAEGPTLRIALAANGPLILQGSVDLSGDGDTCSGSRTALCRCGESANKPFCDGAHKAAGFEAD